MMEQIVEITTQNQIKKVVDFAINSFTNDEGSVYENQGKLQEALQVVKKLDIFDEKLLLKYSSNKQIKIYAVVNGDSIYAACALDERSGRMMFFLEEKNLGGKAIKKLIKFLETKMIAKLSQGEYYFTLLAFSQGAKKLERCGFYRLKSDINLNGIKYVALKYTQEQPDIQNY